MQSTVALGSAESELTGAVRGGVASLSIHSLFGDFGIEAWLCLHMDASAALGVLHRRGLGKIRHVDVGTRWLLEKPLKPLLEFQKDTLGKRI